MSKKNNTRAEYYSYVGYTQRTQRAATRKTNQ